MRDGWQKLPFEDVVADESGGNSKTPQKEFLLTGQIPIVDQSKSLISGYTNDSTRICKSQLPVIIFGDHTRCFKFVNFSFAMGADGVKVLRPRFSVDEKYLFHYLCSLRLPDAGYDRHFKYLKRTEIVLPPTIAEQKRIAAILDKAESLRNLRRQALEQLDAMTQSIFLDMFGNPVTNPKGWEIHSLGNLIIGGLQNGLYKPSSDYGGGTPILRIDAFYNGRVTKLNTLKRVRISEGEQQTYGLQENDIVINRVNSIEYLGKSALIPELNEPTVFESNMMRFRLDRKITCPRFIVEFLQTSFIKAQIRTGTKDAVNQSSINQQDVESFQIRVPPLSLQQEFARRVEALEALKATHRDSLAHLDALFASLQHRAFRGEL